MADEQLKPEKGNPEMTRDEQIVFWVLTFVVLVTALN